MRKSIIPLKSFVRDSVIRHGLLWSFLFSFISLLGLVIVYRQLPPVVPLFYSLTRGENQLAGKQFLFILPFTSFIFLVAHSWLVKINYSTDCLFSRIIAVTSTIISFLFFIALFHIIIILT